MAKSVDPDLIRVYMVCHSVDPALFKIHQQTVTVVFNFLDKYGNELRCPNIEGKCSHSFFLFTFSS